MVLRRYGGNIGYVFGLPFIRAINLIAKARELERKDYFYKWWLARVPMYSKETYETFEEFYEKANPKEIKYDTRSKDELMGEILGI